MRLILDTQQRRITLEAMSDVTRILDRVQQGDAKAAEDSDDTVLAMHDALDALARESPEKAEIVKLHYFTGMEYPEIARALGLSLSTVERHWAYARSWVYREMKKNLSSR